MLPIGPFCVTLTPGKLASAPLSEGGLACTRSALSSVLTDTPLRAIGATVTPADTVISSSWNASWAESWGAASAPRVLAAAVAGSADVIVTLNVKDFPRNLLAEEGISRADPDSFLHGIWQARPELVQAVAEEVLAEANRLSGKTWEMRALLKKARLPRLAKAVAAG